MFDLRYLDHCRAELPYYDRPVHDDFPLVHEELPAGFARAPGDEWVLLMPDGVDLPGQGWKIHVSASPETCAAVLDRTWAYCRAERIAFKFLRGPQRLFGRNSKYADRGFSGKFITIYPTDDGELARVLHGLGDELHGEPGPYILTDLRWREGPLYVRYGAFRLRLGRSPSGEMVPCIEDPDGNLVPDARKPGFRPPLWAPLPAVLGEALDARNAGTLRDFPYRAQRALHFSNGGGVYEAVDTRSGAKVLLKEARPLAGLDGDGRDAVARLRREHWALERLGDLDCVPRAIELRVGNEHHFLVREYVEGVPLSALVRERNPLAGGPSDPATYVDWATKVLGAVDRGITAMHARGVVFNDLHPNNILVTADDGIVFIDLETACPVEEAPAQAMAAPGFNAPPGCTGIDADRYAFGCVGLETFLPLTILAAWGPEKAEQLLALIGDQLPVPADVIRQIRRDLRLPSVSVAPCVPDRHAVVRGIIGAATPERADRLYPGDIRQFLAPVGGVGFAHGAAGVIWALTMVGADVPTEHVAWLLDAVSRAEQPGAGFHDGLSGVAYALDHIGHPETARELLDRAALTPLADLDATVADGLAGLGLTLLHFADRDDDRARLHEAERVAKQLVEHTGRYGPPRPGVPHGPAGHALFYLRLHAANGDDDLLAAATEALTRDVAMLGWPSNDGPWRRMHGLAGPIGTAMVIGDLLRLQDEPQLRTARDDFRTAAHARFVAGAGWLNGRAGTVLGLHHVAEGPADEHAVRRHVKDLDWHAIRQPGDALVFTGEHGLKLSTDLATGSAGVLLAMHTVASGAPTPVPFFAGTAGPGAARS